MRWSPPPRPAPSISPCSHGGSARGVGGSPLQPSLCPRGCPLAAGGTAGCPDPCRAHTALHPELSPTPGLPLPHSLPALPYGEGALPLPSPPSASVPAFGRGQPQPGAVGTPLWLPSSILWFGALLPGPKFWAVLFVCIVGRERLGIIGVVLRIPSPSAVAAELYIPPPPSCSPLVQHPAARGGGEVGGWSFVGRCMGRL